MRTEGNNPFVGPELPVGPEVQKSGPNIVQGKGWQKAARVQPESDIKPSFHAETESKPIDKTRVTVKTGETGGEDNELISQIKEIRKDANSRNLDVLLRGDPSEYETLVKEEEGSFIEQFKASTDHDVNQRNPDGTTPLIVALQEKLIGVAKALLDMGAGVNVKDKDGKSALQLAQGLLGAASSSEERTSMHEFVDALVQAGANESGVEEGPLPTEAEEVSVFKRVLGQNKTVKGKDEGGYTSLGR